MLGSLRAVSLALILFLIFEPVLQKESERLNEPSVAVLVDGSESMNWADSVLVVPDQQLQNKLSKLDNALQGINVQYFTFGSDLSKLDSLESLSLVQGKTDMGKALRSVQDLFQNDPLKSVILVSDGLYNAGANPIHLAERFPVPIYSVAHGDSTLRKDIKIVGVATNELVYNDSEVPVLVRVRNDGFSNQSLSITLSDPSGVLDTRVLAMPPSGTESEVELTFTAKAPGRNNLRVSVSRLDDEATYRNNIHNTTVLVLDQKKRVLLLAGSPSPDVANLARLMLEDETAELVQRTGSPNGSFYQGELPADLNDFDLILSVGFPGPASTPASSSFVVNAVKDGVPLFFVLDRKTDITALKRDFASVLPFIPESIRTGYVDGSMAETALAGSHAIFDTGSQASVTNWNRLPPISINESRWVASPTATMLTGSEIRGVALGDPIIGVARTPSTRSAAFLAHGFWKWSNAPEDLQKESEVFKKIVGNTVQWLLATDDTRLVRVQPAENEYAEGESVVFSGEVYDETLRPVSDAALSIQLTAPDGQLYPFEMASLGNGRYSWDVGGLPSGAYSYATTAMRNEVEIGTDEGAFTVGTRTLEYRNTRADYSLMSQIADRSGGKLLSDNDIAQLSSLIRAQPGFESVATTVLSQIRLWQKLPFLLLILVLLTLEWFFRKRFGMV